MSEVEWAARARVDRVIAACGGGVVWVLGPDPAATVQAWRARGVMAHAGTMADARRQGHVDLLWVRDSGPVFTTASLAEIAQQALQCRPRALVIDTTAPRTPLEQALLRHGWRKHPLYQQVTDYAALEGETQPLAVFEPVPAGVLVGASVTDLLAARDLHMDMLREAGRRADAHVARYMWARRFVRPGDRVLDAACGLGYGSRILADGTLAETVRGLDLDLDAVAYATQHYAASRPRLSFEARDVASLGELPGASFDVIVSFETVEHVADPDAFLAACARLLSPGGRFVCSVPNEWLDEHGVDPNPHHLHVFDRVRLEALCRRHFLLEHTCGQTAGGGMRLPDASRALWDAATREDDAEWWLAVGMRTPLAAGVDPVQTRWQPGGAANAPTLVDFAAHYEHPWIVRAIVSVGLRTESRDLRDALAAETLEQSSPSGADRGAALCVRAYGQLASSGGLAAETTHDIDRYCAEPAANPHAARWQISLRYVQGLGWLTSGDRAAAIRSLTACAALDPLVFSPLLATKSVSACWMLGWLAVQDRDEAHAARWWRAGIDHAERALHRPWHELTGDLDRPLLFGLREAAQVVDLASQCAAGLHLLPHAAERPGLVAEQVAASMASRLERQERATVSLERTAAALQAAADQAWRRCQAAESEVERLRRQLEGLTSMDAISVADGGRRIAIFGSGQGGRQALERLRRAGARVHCFADNDRQRWGQAVDEVPIVDPATLRERGVNFIAVASRPGREAICAQLRGFGYDDGRDFITLD